MSSSEAVRVRRPVRPLRIIADRPGMPADGGSNASSVITAAEAQGKMMQTLAMVSEENVRAAFERGIEEGNRRTTELLQDQYAIRMEEESEKVNRLMESIQKVLVLQSESTELALFQFSLGVAEQIIRREVAMDKEILLNIIKDGIRKIVGVERMKIRIHPADLSFVQEKKQTINSVSDSLREIVFEPDASVEQGGCTIESDIGNVDARIASQLDLVRDIISKQS